MLHQELMHASTSFKSVASLHNTFISKCYQKNELGHPFPHVCIIHMYNMIFMARIGNMWARLLTVVLASFIMSIIHSCRFIGLFDTWRQAGVPAITGWRHISRNLHSWWNTFWYKPSNVGMGKLTLDIFLCLLLIFFNTHHELWHNLQCFDSNCAGCPLQWRDEYSRQVMYS